MVAVIGARNDFDFSAAVDPDDVAPGNTLTRDVHQRTFAPNTVLRFKDHVVDWDRRSSNLARADVEGHRKEPGGAAATEHEMSARNVGGGAPFEQYPMLRCVRGKVRYLADPADPARGHDREEQTSISGDRVGVRVRGLARRQSRQGLRCSPVLGHPPDPGATARVTDATHKCAEENLPTIGPGEPRDIRRRFTESRRRSPVPRDPLDERGYEIRHRLPVGRKNRLLRSLCARNHTGIEAREIPNVELGGDPAARAADKSQTASVSAYCERGARILQEPLSLRKGHGNSCDLPTGHGTNPPGR